MKCSNCGANISELDEICPKCKINLDEYEEKNQEEEDFDKSDKTIFLKIINVVQILGCLIGAIILWSNEEIGIGFVILAVGFVSFAFVKGFQDIIELLDSINNKITNKHS